MTTPKMSEALIAAFGQKVVCDAALIVTFEAMRNGDKPYNHSMLESAVGKCDEAQVEFWRALRLEKKDAAE